MLVLCRYANLSELCSSFSQVLTGIQEEVSCQGSVRSTFFSQVPAEVQEGVCCQGSVRSTSSSQVLTLVRKESVVKVWSGPRPPRKSQLRFKRESVDKARSGSRPISHGEVTEDCECLQIRSVSLRGQARGDGQRIRPRTELNESDIIISLTSPH